MSRFATTIFLFLLSSSLHAQWFDLSTPGIPRTPEGSANLNAPAPMTADGRPDMTGIWVPTDIRGSLFETDKIQAWALDVMAEQEATFYTNSPRFHCLPSGPSSYSAGMSVGGMRRMVQHPDFMAILSPEMTYRQVYMDGRKLEESPLLPNWLGYSIGYWDGDTLVIESNGYNDKTWLTREGLPHTEQLHITERYTRKDFGHIQLEITFDDPGTFTEPVQAQIEMVNMPDSGMLEVICNESATGVSHYSGEMSQAEKKVVDVPTETLEKYIGTYQGSWLGNLITAEIVLEEGEMFLIRTPRYSDAGGNTDSAKSRMIALSDTAFDCSCGLGFVFEFNAEGIADVIYEVHVSGEWPFKRIP